MQNLFRLGLTLCAAATVGLASTPNVMGQVVLDDGQGNALNITPTGIQMRNNQGDVMNVGPGTVHYNSPKYKKQSSTVVKTTAGKGAAVTGGVASQLAAMETNMYGKPYSTDPIIVRIKRLEMDVLGKHATTGGVNERVEILRLSVAGANGGTAVRSKTTNVIVGGAVAIPRGTASHPDATSASASNYIVVNDSGVNQTLQSSGIVVVNSSSCTLKILGKCSILTVNGSDNKIWCEDIGHVQLNGSENTVTWTGTQKPNSVTTGSDNNVVHGAMP